MTIINNKKTIACALTVLALLCIIIGAVQFWRMTNPHYTEVTLTGFQSSDAKLGYSGTIVTSKNNQLVLLNSETGAETTEDICAKWVDALLDENVIVYSNPKNEVGICRFDDESGAVTDNRTILNDAHLRIDPSITRLKDRYYLTLTKVLGTVNNADPRQANGTYTIEL